MKTAIVYDRVNKWGGAERVLLALHKLFPDAPLYTAVYAREKARWADVFPEVIPSFLQNIPFLNNHHELLGAFTPIAFETFDFNKYDLVISVTSEAAKGIITKPGTRHICYCLTPTRYLWSGFNEYQITPPRQLRWIPFYKQVSRPILSYVKSWDKIAAQRPDLIIAISTAVKERIKRYYGRESKVIFPPVDVDKFKNQKSKIKNQNEKNYYLIVSRLEPYKKVDLAIKAFNKLGKKLVIVGVGSEERYLKSIAKSNIKFKGFVNDEDLVSIYHKAVALVHPQDEDFGITSVEAQAAGVPVIAYKSGGVLDTVIEGKTGVFFKSQNVDSLSGAIEIFHLIKFNVNHLRNNADKFRRERFQKEILDLLKLYI